MPYSTEARSEFFRTGMMRQVEYSAIHPTLLILNQVVERDPLSPEIHEFIDSLYEFSIYEWGGEQITTVCQKYHGTTTTIWIVLMVNGLLSRTELRRGMVLRIPTMNCIREILRRMNLANILNGTTVII